MELTTIPIVVPKDMASFVETSDQEAMMERNAMILYPYIKNFIISHGRAAEMLGMNKIDLIEFYARVGLPYLDHTAEDIEEELTAYRRKKDIAVCSS